LASLSISPSTFDLSFKFKQTSNAQWTKGVKK